MAAPVTRGSAVQTLFTNLFACTRQRSRLIRVTLGERRDRVRPGWTLWDVERQVWEAVAPSFLHRVLRFPQVAIVGSGFQPSRRRRTRPEAKETREVAADRRREAERGRDARSGAEQRYLLSVSSDTSFFFLVGYNSSKSLWLPVSSRAKLASATAADCNQKYANQLARSRATLAVLNLL